MTNEVRAKFFALYLGQPYEFKNVIGETIIKKHLGIHEFYRIVPPRPELGFGIFFDYKETKLHLRTIDMLTDEEAITFTKVGSDFFNCSGFEIKVIRELNKISVAAIDIKGTCLIKVEVNNEWKLNLTQTDYLRSIGIVLPFTYIDENGKHVTLSVNELINEGVVKIK